MISIARIHSTMFCSGSVRLSQVVKDAATLHGLELGEEVGVGFRHRSLLLHLHIAINIIGKVVFIILVKSSLLEPRKQIQMEKNFVILLKYSFHSKETIILRRCPCDNLLENQNWWRQGTF